MSDIQLRKHLLAMVLDAHAPAEIMRPGRADAFLDKWEPRVVAAVETRAYDNAIYVIQQARDTIEAEAGDLPSGRTGIAAREHSIRLIEALRDRSGADQ